MQVKFSFCVICKCGTDTLDNTISSILSQTYEQFEVICVYDGASAGDKAYLREYEQKNGFKLICYEKKMGALHKRLAAMNAATGDYMIFLDGTEVCEPTLCEQLYRSLEQKHFPQQETLGDVLCVMSPSAGNNDGQLILDTICPNGEYSSEEQLSEDMEFQFIVETIEKSMELDDEALRSVFAAMYEVFGIRLIVALAKKYWFQSEKFAKLIDVAALFPVKNQDVKTVAMYYHRMYNGGVERVISLLTPILTDLGYKVVVITDEPENKMDFTLPEGVVRVVLNGRHDDGACYETRVQLLEECIEAYQIDAVIYHAWASPSLFWDLCVFKQAGVSFIVHSHLIFSGGLDIGWYAAANVRETFRHADKVCVLSETDRLYWQSVNPNVHVVQNPFTLTEYVPEVTNNKPSTVLWLARFDPEKNPEDALYMMSKVVKKRPDAVLYMVGHIDEHRKLFFKNLIRELGLSGNVVLPGYSTDVQKYFRMADVFLSTSNFEGFPMTYGESFASHVPIVTYDLPYLTILENTNGAICIPWKDTDAGAKAILSLLENPADRNRRAEAAGKKFREMKAYDYHAVWRDILDSKTSETDVSEEVQRVGVLVNTMNLAFSQMIALIQRERYSASVFEQHGREKDELLIRIGEENEAAIKIAKNEVYDSRRYRVGKAVSWLPSKIAAFFRLLKNRGPIYTIKFAWNKTKGKSTEELLVREKL